MLITSVLFHLSRWDLHHFVGNLFYLPVDRITEISVDPLLQFISQYDKKCKCQHYVQHFCTCHLICISQFFFWSLIEGSQNFMLIYQLGFAVLQEYPNFCIWMHIWNFVRFELCDHQNYVLLGPLKN